METIELNVPKYSWINNGEGIDKSIFDIISKYKYLELDNKRLREENKSLKSEQYKDVELQLLEQKCENLQKDLIRGFGISEGEQKRIDEWLSTHECKYRGSRLTGISQYRFGIIPGIGYNGYIKCSCGKEFCFYEEC